MDTRKVTLIATIAAIALLAVGIGYAYTAATNNSSNTASQEYVTLVQANGSSPAVAGAYQFVAANSYAYWDTVDAKTAPDTFVTTFTLSGATNNTPVTGYKSAQIGNDFVVKTTITTPKAASALTNLNCTLSAVGFAAPFAGSVSGEAVLFVVIDTDGSVAEEPTEIFKVKTKGAQDVNTFQKWNSSTSTWADGDSFTIYKNTGEKTYKDFTVTVYYGTTAAGVQASHAIGGQPTGPTAKPLSHIVGDAEVGASLTFTANVTPA